MPSGVPPTTEPYCAVCGRLAEPGIGRGRDRFCSAAHAEAFDREVAAARFGGRGA